MQIRHYDLADLFSVQKPYQYLGYEENLFKKDLSLVDLTFCLAFPDTYEIGMSNLGLQLLYNIINLEQGFVADRAFAPLSDMGKILKNKKQELRSKEYDLPLKNFDILGFSLSFELCFTNVLYMLDLAKISRRSSQRKEDEPIIIAGGPAAGNPEPMAEFVDCFVIGDGEEIVLEICRIVRDGKKKNLSRPDILGELSQLKGVYVPLVHNPNEEVKTQIIERVYLHKLCDAPYALKPIMPALRPIHDRLAIEIQRGCTRSCRFCQAGFFYRPRRERTLEALHEIIDKSVVATGAEELNLLSLSSTEYSQLNNLLLSITKKYKSSHLGISLPSTRLETLAANHLKSLCGERKSGFTIAPEAGSERLRRVINKNLTEQEIFDAVRLLFEHGWQNVKLYFMIGLPTETDEDLHSIGDLVNRIYADIIFKIRGRKNITVAVSNFVPKPHTPFQWCKQISKSETIRRQKEVLYSIKKSPNITFRTHPAELSFVEGLLARGSRLTGNLIEKAYDEGATFDSWHDQFNLDAWYSALEKVKEKHEVDLVFETLRARELMENLPWAAIKCGASLDYLKGEYQKSLEELPTEDCSKTRCLACGACSTKNQPLTSNPDAPDFEIETFPSKVAEIATEKTFLFSYQKIEEGIFVTTLDLQNIFLRAFKRAKIAMAYDHRIRQRPKLTMGPALPLGIWSKRELFIINLFSSLSPEMIVQEINHYIPEHLQILSCQPVEKEDASLTWPRKTVTFSLPLEILLKHMTLLELEEKIELIKNSGHLEMKRERKPRRGGKKVTYIDLKSHLNSISLNPREEKLEFSLLTSENGQHISPYLLADYLLGSDSRAQGLIVFKI